jgi:translation initiation factor IF-2
MTDEVAGRIKVLRLFSINKQAQLLGGKVKEGQITKNAKVKILRRDEEIGTAVVRELQKIKEKVDSVNEGEEFGTMLTERTVDLAEGDMLVPYMSVEK